MIKNNFQFRLIDDIEEATFDKSLEKFYGNGIEGTIKENIQNSLDARLYNDFSQPVYIKIKLDKIHRSQLPGINEVFEHINTLQGGNGYTRETVEYMKEQIDIEEVPVLTIEDKNTKGLTGAKSGQNFSSKDTFGIYAYKKGVHSIDESDDAEKSRGGSHGIGKIANNAASDINLMYFANCDYENNQHIGGTVHLIEHKLNENCFRATGYYSGINENGQFIPFENKNSHHIFRKNTRGLKIIIPYVRDEFFNTNEIIKAICDNFFLAILNNSIVIEISDGNNKEVMINNETIKEIVQDPQYYETRMEEMKKIYTPLYIDTYLNHEPKEIIVSNNLENFKFKLYFNYNEEIFTGRVAILRTIGMKITDLKVNNRVRKPFNAVLVGGNKEDSYLKSLENESHTDISENDIRDKKEKKNAKKFLNNLHLELKKVIDKITGENNTIDGAINTDDLFFETVVSFKKDIQNNTEKVELKKGDEIRKVKETKERRDKVGSKTSNENNNSGGIRRPRKIKRASDSTIETIITPFNAVARILFNKKELLNINIKETGLDSSISKCNLKLKIIDGSGNTVNEKFNIQEYYQVIIDNNNAKKCLISEDTIYEIDINDGIIDLELFVNEDIQNNLKFMYELEVES
ncbi:hypothetical protein QI050_11080 [Staphylococcus saprophyticus]|uniref:Uncharacterized protein n=1 Tax=Staphylococcus saprophyticus TaxID=29385 RepID=A0A380HL92_STASA|nr:hypothetical protein [Staphylococcus saprophyticus]MDW3829202.1 hypothetical protein [Staphylococcus saprophyticus]MDW4219138.1 hypothetical protein [Staphylococcus saprophyticus]MDW4426195.1 hypothetical protein [Staphylococcus saprophyticus]SUM81700.1 Uncharacterised protein [Staphylococcus saprophyticus]